jgi:hypothetical protein
MGRHVTQMGEKRNTYRISVGKPEDEEQDVGGWTMLK